jgi:MscS family membrane protein
MPKAHGLRWLLALLICSIATGASAAAPKESSPAAAAKVAEVKPVAEDPLGRSAPYGSVMGFLRVADKNEYELAARYLEGKQSSEKKADLARNLKVVLNRGLKIGPEDLSKAREGHLDDDLNPYLEKIGTATYPGGSLDIVLRRTTSADRPPVWLFSSETLVGVAAAAERLDLGWGEAIWPDWFRDVSISSYPVFLLLNKLAIVAILLAAAWLVTRALTALLRPVLRRCSKYGPYTASAQLKALTFLLLASAMLRVVATMAVTVAERLFFTSVANVSLIVALSWLLVKLTRVATRHKVLRLQELGMPSTIAAVELTGWLVVSILVITGLFLILRSLGFEVTAAVAGLGVGGIAIAFAAQKTLENLFGTFTIATDRPLRVGDYCQAGSAEGAVESIGLRSTRIRTPERVLVTVPNGQLATMTIGNLTDRDKFLFRHNIHLGYETRAGQLRAVLAKVRQLMSAHAKLEQPTMRIRLTRYGDSCLDIEAFAYVLTRDAQVFLEVQEELLLGIMDIIEASGTSVAALNPPAWLTNLMNAEGTSKEVAP